MSGAIVQSKFGTGTGTGTAVAMGVNPTAGNCLVVFAYDVTNTTTFGISDTLGNSYGSPKLNATSGNGTWMAAWVVGNCLGGGANTVTVTSTVTTDSLGVCVVEVSGIKSAAYDNGHLGAQNSPGAGADAISSGAVSNANTAFILALSQFTATSTGGQTIAKGTNFTSQSGTNIAVQGWSQGFGANTARLEWKASVAPGSNAGTFTDATNGATSSYGTMMVMLDEIPPVHLVQSNTGSGAGVTSLNIAYGSAVSGLDGLIVVAGSTSNVTFTVSDSVNGSWPAAVYNVVAGGRTVSVFSLPPPIGAGTPTVTITANASVTINGCIMEVSAITGTTDQRATNNAGSGATSSSVGPTGALASQGEFALSAVQLGGSSAGWTPGGSYTLIDPTSGSSGLGVSYLTTPDVSAQTPTFTWTTASGYVGVIVTFNTIAGLAYTPYTQTQFFVSDRLTIT